jgi:glycopeptide antibiotics resistance protein
VPYAVVAVFLPFAFSAGRARSSLLISVITLSFLLLATETFQMTLPRRNFDVGDLLYGMAGILIGTGVAGLVFSFAPQLKAFSGKAQ